jgi:hypothetical protein
MIIKAALHRQAIEKAMTTLTPDATDLRLREKGMDGFAHRCFNAMSHDREISGVQIASSLLQLPEYYTGNDNFVQINIWYLRQYIRRAIGSIESASENTECLGDEFCTFRLHDNAPTSRFDNYRWRGPHLTNLTFFEYCMLVQIKKKTQATDFDVAFDTDHPKSSVIVQRLASTLPEVLTVDFNGQLSQFEADENSVPGGHPTTTAIKNDLAEVLLGFFVPWEQLPTLFQHHASAYNTKRDAYSRVWNIVKPTLPA